MACFYPLHGWRSLIPNENGRRPITFKLNGADLDAPISLPCYKCTGCRSDQARDWVVRNYHESKQHLQMSFITLTYDDENLTALNRPHVSAFIKALRKSLPQQIRYFGCGELGESSHRPHYHAIIYGADFLEKSTPFNKKAGTYINDSLQKLWSHGFLVIGAVSPHTIKYVCGYTQKKLGQPSTFNFMSRNPGIGTKFLETYQDNLGELQHTTMDGRIYPIPKKYLELAESSLQHVRDARSEYVRTMTPETKWVKTTNLRTKEINLKAKLNQRKNTI